MRSEAFDKAIERASSKLSGLGVADLQQAVRQQTPLLVTVATDSGYTPAGGSLLITCGDRQIWRVPADEGVLLDALRCKGVLQVSLDQWDASLSKPPSAEGDA